MGQKLAAFDVSGQIMAFYDSIDSPPADRENVIPITNEEWQMCLSQPGWTVANGKLLAPIPPAAAVQLQQAQRIQCQRLQAACESAITASFKSMALGPQPYVYGSQLTDQNNLLSALSAAQGQPANWSTPLWCADGKGDWSFLPHTAAQVLQVNQDWVAFRTMQQQKYASLIAQVQVAATVQAVQAVAWQ
ncbi:hypothetical protein C2134_05025 [Chromobacterium sinusclupearum]|uniref:DUF4376 domain-containing protein n=1 Tax=Chromobacterium sinusclupearum TaxID=2077146 RepID=A0A2K4MSJ6_9NEIS|nr:hypothetical protein [Chromobacterium sinusclupearum]POA99735.1 hypothetical protein C2134_05025 [Chromobacterium sinusclupearum]